MHTMASPKATLHMLHAHSEEQPRYETVSVPEEHPLTENPSAAFFVKPGSVQSGGFRCTLFVPNYPPVVSEVFPRKKEAEQDAAKKALEQMGKDFTADNLASKALTSEERLSALVERIGAIFSEKVIMSSQPMKEHFRAAMKGKTGRNGAVSAAVLAVLDNRINSLCKCIQASSDNDPLLALALVWEAARSCPSVSCENGYLIKDKAGFSPQFQAEFLDSDPQEAANMKFQAVFIPSCEDWIVREVEIEIDSQSYYMDTLAKTLGVKESSCIMMSRTVPRAPHDTRLYCVVPDMLIQPSFHKELVGIELSGKDGLLWNTRASELLGYSVYGDAILASVGSTWKSGGKLMCTDVSKTCYYRLLLGRTPEGSYKLSRDAILVSKLPSSFSSRSQWRGTLPRSLLIDFCHQHRLADPEFDTVSIGAEKKRNCSYKCSTKIVRDGQVMFFESEHYYRNRNDAEQSAALQALLHFSKTVGVVPKHQNSQNLLTPPCCNDQASLSILPASANGNHLCSSDHQTSKGPDEAQYDFNRVITNGSMVCVSCDVWLIGCGHDVKVEEHEEFEFQLGVGGVIAELENAVSGMQVDEYMKILLPIPNRQSILSIYEAAHNFEKSILDSCSLRYNVKVLRILEPAEDRMESALFSPPLSKQRNAFAAFKIKELNAKSLVDFGCGSGSLLEAIVDNMTDLKNIAGVDISLKGLHRAAKSLTTKLSLKENNNCKKLKQVVLYEGSLAEPDPRFCGFDVATCIEVVEHMDPEPLSKAADIILGNYAPRTLLLSTPNIEYNVLLQKGVVDAKTRPVGKPKRVRMTSTELNSEELLLFDEKEKSQNVSLSDDESSAQPIRLRNDDHRFEWTRAEFQEWANSLAVRFGYTVEFTGVGGSVEDPGFASQIAIFTWKAVDSSCSETSFKALVDQKSLPMESNIPSFREVWKYDTGGASP